MPTGRDTGLAVGLDIGGTKTLGVLLGPDDAVLGSVRLPTTRGVEGVVTTAAKAVRALTDEAGTGPGALVRVGGLARRAVARPRRRASTRRSVRRRRRGVPGGRRTARGVRPRGRRRDPHPRADHRRRVRRARRGGQPTGCTVPRRGGGGARCAGRGIGVPRLDADRRAGPAGAARGAPRGDWRRSAGSRGGGLMEVIIAAPDELMRRQSPRGAPR